MGRTRRAAKNILFGYVSNLTYTLLGFALRTVFIWKLGDTLLGVDGLYTNILSVVSLAELGIGTAMNYSLYGPVAGGDTEKIKSYMRFFRRAYRVIAAVVALLGLCVIPFLPYIVRNTIGLTARELTNYYLIFLFNTVSTYFMAYKYSLVNAEQKNYIQTNAATVSKIITSVIQIIILLTTADFFAYLLTVAVVELVQKLVMNVYLNRKYPYLSDKNAAPLGKEETTRIAADTGALAIQKAGDAARLQTDAIIISSFLNVSVVALVNNYNMIITAVTGFVDIIFNSVISGFGNLIATEGRERQYEVFRVYRFAAAWLYGYTSLGFWFLLSPLIGYAWGEERILGFPVIFCIVLDYYLKGERIVLYNFKTAAGIFKEDKYLAFAQGIVNLILSVIMVQKIGLLGVYVGTVVSGLMANLLRPFLIYRICFEKRVVSYFRTVGKYSLHLLICAGILLAVRSLLPVSDTLPGILVLALLVTVVFNGSFVLIFGRSREFSYLYHQYKKISKKGKGEGTAV